MVSHHPTAGEDELDHDTEDAFVLAMEEEKRQEHAEKQSQRQLQRRIQRIKTRVGLYAHITFNEMGAAGASDHQNLLSGLQYISEEEDEVAGWERFVRMLFSEHLQSARVLHSRMERELDRGRGSISQRDAAEWELFYRSPSYDYKHKESQIQQILPIEIDRAIAVRLERDQLLKEAHAQRIPASYTLRDDAVFLNLSLSSRRTALASFREDLRQLSGELDEAHSKLKHQLVARASGTKACLPLDEAYRMLGRAFDQAENAKDIERFERSVLRYEIARAEQLRADYDEAEGVLDRFSAHMPAAFYRRTPASFLQLSVAGRAAYIESVRNAARAASVARDAEEARCRAADAEEAAVKAALAAGDWKAAKVHIETLERLDPRRTTLMTLMHSVDEAEIAGQKEEAIEESRQALERQVKAIGSKPLATAYEAALAGGAGRFASFAERLERGRIVEQAKQQAVSKSALPAKSGEPIAEQPAEPVPAAKRQPTLAVIAPASVQDAKKPVPVAAEGDDDEEGKVNEDDADEDKQGDQMELEEVELDEDGEEQEVVTPVAVEDDDDDEEGEDKAAEEGDRADEAVAPKSAAALVPRRQEAPKLEKKPVSATAPARKPVQRDAKKTATAKSAPNKPQKQAVKAVAVEAKKTADIQRAVETLDRREDDKTALVLRHDGESISDERQQQARQLHEGFLHHLGVLQRHDVAFRPDTTRQAA